MCGDYTEVPESGALVTQPLVTLLHTGLVRLAHPSQVGAVRAAVQRGHQDVVVGRRDVRRIRDQRLCVRQRCSAGKEAAVVHLRASRQRLSSRRYNWLHDLDTVPMH
jgi:hypothetical protein